MVYNDLFFRLQSQKYIKKMKFTNELMKNR